MFFACPYQAREKGSVQQLNGLIRGRFPKRTDFRTVPAAALYDLRDHRNFCPLQVTGGRLIIDFFGDLCP